MADDKILQARVELRQMAKANLFKMAFCQKEKKCVLGGACPFLLEYQCILFCISEILGQGCQIEKLRLLSDEIDENEDKISLKGLKLAIGPCLPRLG